jgi:hypothetical protein
MVGLGVSIGQPQSGSLVQAGSRYYRIDVRDHHVDLTISVTRSYGDPDLYVIAGNAS